MLPRLVASLIASTVIYVVPSAQAGDPFLYLSDYTLGKIYESDASGNVTTFINSGLNGPGGLIFDTAGNLYTANWNNGTVAKITPGGSVSTYASGFQTPFGLAFDTAGNLYVSNPAGGSGTTISRVTPQGSVSTFATGLSQPMSLAFDSSGILYCCNNASGTVSKISPNGSVSTFASGLATATGLAIDSANNVYTSINDHTNTGTIVKITPSGTESIFASNVGNPYGIHFDFQDNLYVGTSFGTNDSSQVLKITPSGTVTTFVPPPNGRATDVIPIPGFATWNGSVGNWSDATRWTTNPVAPNNGTPANAHYDPVINGGIVTLDINPTLNSLTISGGSLTGAGNISFYRATVMGTYDLTGTTTITGGSLIFGGTTQHAGPVTGTGSLQINAGTALTSGGVTITGTWAINGTHNISLGAGDSGTSKVSALPAIAYVTDGFTVTFTATLNLSDSKLIVQSTDPADKTTKITQLNAAIASGSNAGTWTGTGITSSTAAADPSHYGVGIFDNALLHHTSFGGQPVDSNSIFTTVAHLGDANDNGIVDIQDFTIVAHRWQQSRNNWTEGDLNGDGIVDVRDLTIVANNWQQTSSFSQVASPLAGFTGTAGVPEPTSLLLVLAGIGMLACRRVRNRRH